LAKILFLTQIVPFPPDAGPKVKTYHVIRALVQQGHSVTLVSFVRPEEVLHIPALQEICEAVHAVRIHRSRIADVGYMVRSYLKGRPFLIERDDLRPMQDVVTADAKGIEVRIPHVLTGIYNLKIKDGRHAFMRQVAIQ